jgi:formate hydrogenlyase subunit 4
MFTNNDIPHVANLMFSPVIVLWQTIVCMCSSIPPSVSRGPLAVFILLVILISLEVGHRSLQYAHKEIEI